MVNELQAGDDVSAAFGAVGIVRVVFVTAVAAAVGEEGCEDGIFLRPFAEGDADEE